MTFMLQWQEIKPMFSRWVVVMQTSVLLIHRVCRMHAMMVQIPMPLLTACTSPTNVTFTYQHIQMAYSVNVKLSASSSNTTMDICHMCLSGCHKRVLWRDRLLAAATQQAYVTSIYPTGTSACCVEHYLHMLA